MVFNAVRWHESPRDQGGETRGGPGLGDPQGAWRGKGPTRRGQEGGAGASRRKANGPGQRLQTTLTRAPKVATWAQTTQTRATLVAGKAKRQQIRLKEERGTEAVTRSGLPLKEPHCKAGGPSSGVALEEQDGREKGKEGDIVAR